MKYNDFRKKMRFPIFNRQDLRLVGGKVFNYQLSLWQKQGYILKIRNGLYIFEDQTEEISPEEIAAFIYTPSYISLEKALSIYGIIPEVVYSFTCITPKITRNFNNKFGTFIYRHIKPSLYFGYREVKSKKTKYLIAEPEKALLDLIYFNLSKIKTKKDLDGFRFNRYLLKREASRNKLKKYLAQFKNKRMESITNAYL